MTALLETHGVSKYYGEFCALDDVSISLQEGELVSIVGPNGAGKTTLVNVLTGLLRPSAGNVLFMGSDIAGVGPVLLAERGLARAFQLIQIFPRLSVAETISTAVITRQRKRWKLFTSFAADAAVSFPALPQIHDKLATGATNSPQANIALVGGRTHGLSVRICETGRPVGHYGRYTFGRRIPQAMVWTQHPAFDPDRRTVREESLREPIDDMRRIPHRDIGSRPTDFGSAGCRL